MSPRTSSAPPSSASRGVASSPTRPSSAATAHSTEHLPCWASSTTSASRRRSPPPHASSPPPPPRRSPHRDRPSVPPTGGGRSTAATAVSSSASSTHRSSWSVTPSPATSIASLRPRTRTPTSPGPCSAPRVTATKAPSSSSSWALGMNLRMIHGRACTRRRLGSGAHRASSVLHSWVEMLPSLLVPDTLYFNCEHSMKILAYEIGRHELSQIEPPCWGLDVGVFAIELKSGQVKKVGEASRYYAVFPHMSFYTSDLARGRLAQPAGVQ